MKFLMLVLMCTLAFGQDLEPKTVMYDLSKEDVGYLAMTGKEQCKDKYEAAQERANAFCFSNFHLMAVEKGFETMPTEREFLLKVSKYDTKLVDPKIYKCKKPRMHPRYIAYTKFAKINCLSL